MTVWARTLLVVVLMGCVAYASPAKPQNAKVDSTVVSNDQLGRVTISEVPFGVILRNQLWKFGNFSAGTLNICWEESALPFEQERQWVREAVTATWQANSGLRFAGWNRCPSGARFGGVRIGHLDSEESLRVVNGGGKQIEGVQNGVLLNFQFSQMQAYYESHGGWPFDDCTTQEMRETCIRATSIHEFGHVLAFAHEHLHRHTPDDCEYRSNAGRRVLSLTQQYDGDSVMTYCRANRMRVLELSTLDIATLQALYCRPGERTCRGYQVGMIVE